MADNIVTTITYVATFPNGNYQKVTLEANGDMEVLTTYQKALVNGFFGALVAAGDEQAAQAAAAQAQADAAAAAKK